MLLSNDCEHVAVGLRLGGSDGWNRSEELKPARSGATVLGLRSRPSSSRGQRSALQTSFSAKVTEGTPVIDIGSARNASRGRIISMTGLVAWRRVLH
jgi:hypothetical protein